MRYPQTATIIQGARKRKGVSQERAAIKVGCSRLQWIRWEQGLHRPAADGLAPRLAEYLGLDLEVLLSADDEDEEASSMPTHHDMVAVLMPSEALRRIVREEMASKADA